VVSQNIKIFRVTLKLDQDEFAKRLGVTQPTISSWENGKTKPDVDHILTIVDMGANIYFILHGIGSPLMRMSA